MNIACLILPLHQNGEEMGLDNLSCYPSAGMGDFV